MGSAWANNESFLVGGSLLLAVIALGVWGNLLYEVAKSHFNLEETLASRKSEGWNSAKTSAIFLSFLMIMQGLILYTTISRAAEPLIEEEKIDHWIELYKVEETLEILEDYEKEEVDKWYITRELNRFLGQGLMETGILFIHLGLFFQSLYRGNRKNRLTEKGLYTFEGKRKIAKISHYKIRHRPKEATDILWVYAGEPKIRFWESFKEPKKVILDVEREDLRDLEDLFRIADIEKEEGS